MTAIHQSFIDFLYTMKGNPCLELTPHPDARKGAHFNQDSRMEQPAVSLQQQQQQSEGETRASTSREERAASPQLGTSRRKRAAKTQEDQLPAKKQKSVAGPRQRKDKQAATSTPPAALHSSPHPPRPVALTVTRNETTGSQNNAVERGKVYLGCSLHYFDMTSDEQRVADCIYAGLKMQRVKNWDKWLLKRPMLALVVFNNLLAMDFFDMKQISHVELAFTREQVEEIVNRYAPAATSRILATLCRPFITVKTTYIGAGAPPTAGSPWDPDRTSTSKDGQWAPWTTGSDDVTPKIESDTQYD